MLKYVLYFAAALYALLSMVAAGTQLWTTDKRGAPSLMILGGMLLLLSAGLEAAALFDSWPIAALGGVCISIAAFLNGRQSGNFHLKHHIIRFAVTLLLIVGFYMF